MIVEWKTTRVGDQINLQRGFDITRDGAACGPFPVISSSGTSFYNDKAMVSGPGVVIGRKGTLGTVFYVEGDYWPHDTTLWVTDFCGNNPRFVYYFLKSLSLQDFDVGSANPTLNRNHVHPIEVLWPPREEQDGISYILSTIDGKIESNCLVRRNLESAMEQIFKSMFKGKEEKDEALNWCGRSFAKYTSDQNRASDGWSIVKFGQITDRISMGPFGSRIKAENFVDAGVPVIRGSNLAGMFVDGKFAYLSNEKADELSASRAEAGDIVFTHRGTVGQVSLVPDDGEHKRYVVSQSQMVATVNEEMCSRYYAYLYFSVGRGRWEIESNINTTGVPAISRPSTFLKNVTFPLPNRELMSAFDGIVRPMFNLASQCDKESSILLELRDLLLPKLMSGEIRVKDAERMVGDVI
ncbi:type I restriction enzyme S subunit [Azospirillum sp. OGB3]|uniref:restriction endonuclease subunit S n=1 Tax=Azospirillum sp. OGB3 TaxID=2587012 RepID=UPI001606D0CE|nr:restriction endonuclease subunit S [Azospirillum sp. OGB3]MBB3267606.1 type I restriction enzyme S subunit [Azospirillum sp. OGB3]